MMRSGWRDWVAATWKGLRSGRRTRRPRPWLEALEERTVPSTILWANRGVTSGPDNDRFNDVFGARADIARADVAAALQAWQDLIADFHYADGSNTLTVTVTMGTTTGFGADATFGGPWTDGVGKPTRGAVVIGTGDDAFGSGWFLDPTPTNATAFRGPIINPYVGSATPGSPAETLHDLFSVVAIEMAHVVGLNDADNEDFALDPNHYLTPTAQPDTSDPPGNLWTFNGPDVRALFTTDNGDAESRPSALHVARPDPGNVVHAGGVTYLGAEDTDNASYDVGRRFFPTTLDALVLKDAYGYDVVPPTGHTFHALFDPASGNLLLRGGQLGEDVYAPGSPSNDVITVGTVGSGSSAAYVVTVQLGNPIPGTGPNRPLVSTYLASRVHSITIGVGDGNSVVNVEETTANTVTTITSHGHNTINLGRAGSLQGIRGPVHVSGASAFALNLDDSADTAGRSMTIGRGVIQGLAPTAIHFRPSELTALTIKGGRGANLFNVTTPTPGTAVHLDGGSGANTLAGPGSTNVWHVTGHNTGSLDGLVTFTSVAGLLGGPLADTFVFANGAGISGSINGGGGSNTLDYSAYTAPLLVNLRTGWATGVGNGVRNVQNVTGGSGNDVLIGGASGSVLKGSDEAILLGGPGNDLLIAGSRSLLIGGSGADHLTAGKDSILIGGTTVYVNEATGAVNLEALHRIMAEWTSSASLAQRVGHLNGTLRGGSNGHFFLNAATVHPTASADWFSAGTSGEWFLYGPTDVFAGRVNLANDRKTLV